MNKKTTISRILMVVGLVSAFECAAAETAGRILVAVGEVFAVRNGKDIALTQGAVVESGDTLRTGATSNAQMRLTDGAIVSLRPQTEFRIDEYHFTSKEDGSEKGIFSLVKGGFRTISGLIGKANQSNYKVTTATAAIGIRGTDYSLVMCAQDCTNADGSKAKDGLYGGVAAGKINVANDGGGKDFGHAEAFYVPDAHTAPQSLIAPPSFLADKLAARSRNQNRGGSDGGGSGGGGNGGGSGSQSQAALTPDGRSSVAEVPVLFPAVTTTTYVAAETVSASGASSVLPAANFIEAQVAYAFQGSSEVIELCNGGGCDGVLDASNGVVRAWSDPLHSFAFNSGGSLVDTGNASVDGTTVSWGRWSAATVQDPWNSGTPPTGLHFIVTGGGPYGSSDPAVIDAKTSSVTYSFVDGTHVTDSNGNIGTKMSGSFGINFLARSITPDISYSVGGSAYHVIGFSMSMPAGQIGINSGPNANGTGSCTGGVCGGGRAIDFVVLNTTFIGATGSGVIASLATAVTPGGTPVSTAGVGLFKAP